APYSDGHPGRQELADDTRVRNRRAGPSPPRRERVRPVSVRVPRRALLALAALACAPACASAAVIQTVPEIEKATMRIEGVTFHADSNGRITIPDALIRLRNGVPANVTVDKA